MLDINEQVKRNADRFPSDKRSQIAAGSQKHRDPRFLCTIWSVHSTTAHLNKLRWWRGGDRMEDK